MHSRAVHSSCDDDLNGSKLRQGAKSWQPPKLIVSAEPSQDGGTGTFTVLMPTGVHTGCALSSPRARRRGRWCHYAHCPPAAI